MSSLHVRVLLGTNPPTMNPSAKMPDSRFRVWGLVNPQHHKPSARNPKLKPTAARPHALETCIVKSAKLHIGIQCKLCLHMQGRKYPTLRSLDQSSVEQLALVYWIRGIFQAQVQGCSVTWRDCLGSNMVVKNLSHLESHFFQREVRSHLLPTSALSLARSLARSLSLSLSPLSLSFSLALALYLNHVFRGS